MIETSNLCKSFIREIKDDRGNNVKKKFKTKKEEFLAVNNVSFRAEKGQIIGILTGQLLG